MTTLKDIAKACGVSTATVSYVVNKGPRPVLPATRERVERAILELGYHPNAHARGLRGMRTDTLGVVFPHITLPLENVYFAPVLEGILSVTTDRHLATMLFTGFTWEEAEMSAPKLCDGRCDGFLLIAPMRKSRLVRDLVAREAPVVVVGTHPDEVDVSTVDADNVEGARIAVKHLIDLGHRRIAVTPTSSVATSASERVRGYRLAMAEAGLAVDESLVTSPPGPKTGIQTDILHKLLCDPAKRPTAIFAVQDGTAISAVRVAQDLGLEVPGDLSVVGFDDIPVVATLNPAITTIRQPMRQIGVKGAELLCERIESPLAATVTHLFDTLLIERSTTASPTGSRDGRSIHSPLVPQSRDPINGEINENASSLYSY